MGNSKARWLGVVTLLASLIAWADPPELPKPFSELVTQCLQHRDCPLDCEGKLCAMVVGERLAPRMKHLWVGPRDSATARSMDFILPDGWYGLHWLGPTRVELTGLSNQGANGRTDDVSQVWRFEVLPDGGLREEPSPTERAPSANSGPTNDRMCSIHFPRDGAGQSRCLTEKTAPLNAMKTLRSSCPPGKDGRQVLGLCNAAGCALAAETQDNGLSCAMWIPKSGKPSRLIDDVSWIVLGADELELTISLGCPTGCDTSETFRLGPPLVLEIPTRPLRARGVLDVPPKSSPHTPREVETATSAHLTLGQASWGGPSDVSARWALTHGEKTVNVTAVVKDDHVVPLAKAKSSLGSDHLEIELQFYQYDVLLLDGGAVSIRRTFDKKPRDPQPPAVGSWSATKDGYRVQVTLPVEQEPASLPPVRVDGALFVSDSDDGSQVKARIGVRIQAMLWRTYPPVFSEVQAQEFP